jgi:voltage-gated potassium channel
MTSGAPTPEDAPAPRRNLGSPAGALRYSAVELLVALGLLFISGPVIEDLPSGDLIEAALVSLVMISAVLAVGGRRRSLIVALILLAPALVGKWVNHFRPDLLHPAFFLVASFVFFAFVVARLLAFLVREPRVDANVLCAGVSGFLLLGLLWVPAYAVVYRLNPHAFVLPTAPGAPATLDSFTAFYYSFMTLCTVGYGDITPVSRVARMLAVTESITGMFYMAVLISRLVSLHSSSQPATGNGKNLSDNH